MAGSAMTASFSATCIIEELSEKGARLRFSYALVLPLKFILKFEDHGYEEMVTMVWRKGDVVGVSFARPIPMERLGPESSPAENRRQVTLQKAVASRRSS
jgi:hypothetical protein